MCWWARWILQEEFEALKAPSPTVRKIGVPKMNKSNFPGIGDDASPPKMKSGSLPVTIQGSEAGRSPTGESRLRHDAKHFYGVPAKESEPRESEAKGHKSKYGPNAVSETPVSRSSKRLCIYIFGSLHIAL